MTDVKDLTGMPVEDVIKHLEGYKVTVVDVSRPDKYHKDVKGSLRVVKATLTNGEVELLVAGFADKVEE